MEKIYMVFPDLVQNTLITIYDFYQYRRRHGGRYNEYKSLYRISEKWNYDKLKNVQERRFLKFYNSIKDDSVFFKRKFKNISVSKLTDIIFLPFLTKEEIRVNIDKIVSQKKNSFISHTGGTTGKSLKVFFSWKNAQERFACLDNFKERFGWRFGMKTAWFSGKNILSERDTRNCRYWKTDYLYNIRYYSTYHISEKSAHFYINNLNCYQPKYLSGFSSSIAELAKIGLRLGLKLNYKVEAIFPTAESLQENDVKAMRKFYGAIVADQYSSSEGAPFITQCVEGHMHLEHLSGIFEVLDKDGNSSDKGELVVSSFTTEKTPLLRYRIGDYISLDNEIKCQAHTGQVVKKIHGRINDYIYSNETGKINLGNISNCVKYTPEIVKFQIIQDEIEKIIVKVVVDKGYNKKQENIFLMELRSRFGSVMDIQIEYVKDIPREKSGKYRMLKNNIKGLKEIHLIET